MTATTQPESKSSSRRALLAGALGGLGAAAASMLGRASPVEAAAGDPIRMGQLNRAGGTRTSLQTTTSTPAFTVLQYGTGTAIKGDASLNQRSLAHGVHGTASFGSGVHGVSQASHGVWGEGGDQEGNAGVKGTGDAYGVYGVLGQSTHAFGVKGGGEAAGVMGIGIYNGVLGTSQFGLAGHFLGPVVVGAYSPELMAAAKRSAPDPALRIYLEIEAIDVQERGIGARLFARFNDSDKMELCVKLGASAVQVIATEP
jgi:hypothetical protein